MVVCKDKSAAKTTPARLLTFSPLLVNESGSIQGILTMTCCMPCICMPAEKWETMSCCEEKLKEMRQDSMKQRKECYWDKHAVYIEARLHTFNLETIRLATAPTSNNNYIGPNQKPLLYLSTYHAAYANFRFNLYCSVKANLAKLNRFGSVGIRGNANAY